MPYTGRDGLTHQETIIDWDKTLTTKMFIPHTAEEMAEARKFLEEWRERTITDILAISPALCGERYIDYVKRDLETKTLSWYDSMIRDPSLSFEFLRDMITILEKRQEAFANNAVDLLTPQVKH